MTVTAIFLHAAPHRKIASTCRMDDAVTIGCEVQNLRLLQTILRPARSMG